MPRILVVDDEPGIAESIELILRESEYEVTKSYSGAEALQVAASFLPDVLLSDVLMPGMNGFELALATKAVLPQCRVLLFSGQAATLSMALEYSSRFTARGYHFELLPKPLHPQSLLEKIQNSLTAAA